MECKEWLAFGEANPDAADEILELICESVWSDTKPQCLCLSIEEHNALNYTARGTIEHKGKTYEFVIDNGNWNGTVVRKWAE